jgi:hypothetical protein
MHLLHLIEAGLMTVHAARVEMGPARIEECLTCYRLQLTHHTLN